MFFCIWFQYVQIVYVIDKHIIKQESAKTFIKINEEENNLNYKQLNKHVNAHHWKLILKKLNVNQMELEKWTKCQNSFVKKQKEHYK
uniref:Uncharacterized protein n=1 Tax=Meloidogyne enterolobii TaxID=390850 RepID=A0A6V7Y2Z1_MELEN|nr:unnamed protein product [Meloidogyne enterolobii]